MKNKLTNTFSKNSSKFLEMSKNQALKNDSTDERFWEQSFLELKSCADAISLGAATHSQTEPLPILDTPTTETPITNQLYSPLQALNDQPLEDISAKDKFLALIDALALDTEFLSACKKYQNNNENVDLRDLQEMPLSQENIDIKKPAETKKEALKNSELSTLNSVPLELDTSLPYPPPMPKKPTTLESLQDQPLEF